MGGFHTILGLLILTTPIAMFAGHCPGLVALCFSPDSQTTQKNWLKSAAVLFERFSLLLLSHWLMFTPKINASGLFQSSQILSFLELQEILERTASSTLLRSYWLAKWAVPSQKMSFENRENHNEPWDSWLPNNMYIINK